MAEKAENVDRLIVVDDDIHSLELEVYHLRSFGYEVEAYTDPDIALQRLKMEPFSALVTDLLMPHIDGIELARAALEAHPEMGIVVISAQHTREALRELQKRGIYFLLTKPFTREQLEFTLLGALEMRRRSVSTLEAKEGSVSHGFGIAGTSQATQELRRQISRAATADVPILIYGESGTGKELVARAIHSLGSRSQFPLISMNCAAVSATLAESEIFGHKEGAFTGAVKKHRGLIEHADRGILFLDEIGDMPLELQAKFLRVLDAGELRRVGEAEPIKVNVRIISATNRDLNKMVEAETFRKDLYYRISGFTIKTTPLRERREDIPLLTMFFLKELSQDLRKTLSIQPEALSALTEHGWSGNVRELKHCISILAHTSPAGQISVDNVREALGHPDKQIEFNRAVTSNLTALSASSYANAKNQLLDSFEKEYFSALLASVHGNVSKASEIADMHRKNLLDKLKRLEINPNTFRA